MQVFEINPLRAWGAVATTVVSVALSVYLISISPWYMLPFAWAFAGTAWTGVSAFPLACSNGTKYNTNLQRLAALSWPGMECSKQVVMMPKCACANMQMFVVGHDCGHRSFSKNKLVEDIVGTLMFMPLIYPFEPWRIKHNHHHAHTNKCVALLFEGLHLGNCFW